MGNPVEEFLLEKRALGFNMSAAKPMLGTAAKAMGTAVAAGVGTAAFAGLAGGAGKLYLTATKTRDFRSMMEANPDLHSHSQRDPAGFNRMFTSLRTFAPEFTQDPLVAGTYMRRAMEDEESTRGMTAVQAMGALKQQRTSPVIDEAMSGFRGGLSGAMRPGGDNKRPLLRGSREEVFEPGTGEGVVSRVKHVTHEYE